MSRLALAHRPIAVATTLALALGGAVAFAAPAHAADTATISGVVTGEAYGDVAEATLAGINVALLVPDGADAWALEDIVTTVDGGTFAFDGLPAGSYSLAFNAASGLAWVPEVWDDQPIDWDGFTGATEIALEEGETFTADTALTKSASITGLIVGSDATTVELVGAQAIAYPVGEEMSAGNAGLQSASDEESGYSIDGLAPGEYEVQFTDASGGSHVGEWWEDVPDREFSTVVTVDAGDVVSAIDAELTAGGSIAGTVSLSNGSAPTASVLLFDDQDELVESTPVSGGEFTFSGLIAGDYRVGFTGASIAAEFYNDKSTLDDADVISVDGDVTDIAATVASLKKFTTQPTPAIVGTAKVGVKLTSKVGAFTPTGAVLDYEWKVAGVSVATTKNYTPTAADKGKKITLTVTASKAGYTAASKTSKSTKAVLVGTITAVTPKITGSAKVGATLTAVPGTWKPAGATLTYQWLRQGKTIVDATAPTYTLVASDRGKKISVKVIATADGYTKKSATSAAKVIGYGTITASGIPTVTGTARVAETLAAHAEPWAPEGTTLSYQWNADKKAISGATSSTLVVPGSVAGKKITVTVSGKKSGYTTVAKTSVATAAVAKADLVAGAAPTVAGAAAYPSTLSASAVGWESTTKLSYQWLRDGAAISKATKATYVVTRADRGHTISVKLTASRTGYTTLTALGADSFAIPALRVAVNSTPYDSAETEYYSVYVFETTPATATIAGGEYFEFVSTPGFFNANEVSAAIAWGKKGKYGGKEINYTVSSDGSTLRVKIPTGSLLKTLKDKKKAGYALELQVTLADDVNEEYFVVTGVFTALKF